MSIVFNNTVYAAGFAGEDDGAPKSSFGLDNVSTNSITVLGTVSAVGDSVKVTGLLPGSGDTGNTSTTNTLYVTTFDNAGMIEFSDTPPASQGSSSFRYVLSNSQLVAKQKPVFDTDPTLSEYQTPCFASGTRIATSSGDVAVEDLAVGDLVVTASGAQRPIRWLGHRTLDCRRHPRPDDVNPIRIAAHAFGASRPARDLLVSPGHAICVDILGEILVPAVALVNGASIRQVEVDEVTYWHVELESHDVIVAENLPTESYLDMGNRTFFAEADVIDLAAGPDADAAHLTDADFCRPYHNSGILVEAARAQLRGRAEASGWTTSEDPLAGMHLLVDGMRLEPRVRNLSACFAIPAGARDIWLVSESARPCDTMGLADGRRLGLCLGGLTINDGFVLREMLADPRLCVGFHDMEGEGEAARRWTAGRAHLPASLWEGNDEPTVLRIDLAGPCVARWVEPSVEIEATRAA